MKSLVIVGNKDIDKDISKFVDGCDKVVRLNRMMNYGMTGIRTDLLLADIHEEFLNLVTPPFDKFLGAKHLLVNYKKNFPYFPEAIRRGIFSISQISKSTHISLPQIADKFVKSEDFLKTKTFPTNFFLLTSYIIDNYSKDYELWITAVDVAGRDEIFNT